ncbi:type VII secretion integral membrane protein EccD [Mycobacterium sp. ITM-2017-0098]|nr:type VII secretion integral membrane protein EccD [Mycobacterium sp. ITM-2017-0098]
MPNTLCRLAVHATGPGESTAAELVLPATRPLGELLPSIVDAVLGDAAPPRHWRLTRVAGAALDTSLSLRDNGFRDGDMVLLATVQIACPRRLPTESCGVVAGIADTREPPTGRGAVLAVGLAGTAACAAALIRSGHLAAEGWPLWSAAALAAAAATGSVAVGRTDHHVAALLSTAAVVFGATTGILAVPGATWQAVFLLSAAVAFAISVVLLRVTGGDVVLTALAASTGVTAAAAVCATVAPQPEAAGAVLTVVALGALSLAPTFTAATTGLGPARHHVDERRAASAHRTLTGLVAGLSGSAALGAAVVAAVAVHTGSSAVLAGVFAADLGIILVLRQRSHVDGYRRAWLGATGFGALLIAAVVTVITQPAHGFWICAAAAVASGVWLRRANRPEVPNPLVYQGIQIIEYLALAAVIPLAFWVTGLYGLVRELSLS